MPRRSLFPVSMRTKRTQLRRICIADAAGWKRFNNRIVKRMSSEGLAWPIVPSVVYARNELLHYAQMWERGERYVYAILDRKTGEVIGDFHLKGVDRAHKRVEFGHALDPSVWGTGITHETLDVVMRTVRARGFVPWCQVEEENIRSWRSLEHHGAKFIGEGWSARGTARKRMRRYEL